MFFFVLHYSIVGDYKNIDVLFAIDNSKQVPSKTFNLLTGLIKNIVSQLNFENEQIRMGLLSFGGDPVINLDLQTGNNANDILNGIRNMRVTNSDADLKSLIPVLKEMFENQVMERNGRYFVLFLNSPVNVDTMNELREVLKDAEVNLLVVDVGQNNKGVLDVGQQDDISYQVIFIRRDDIYSIFHIIINGLQESKKEKGSTLFVSVFLPVDR